MTLCAGHLGQDDKGEDQESQDTVEGTQPAEEDEE